MKSSFKYNLASIIILFAILTIFPYLIVRTVYFFTAPIPWYDKTIAFFLLLAEIFAMFHAFGYFINLYYVFTSQRIKGVRTPIEPTLSRFPPVAITVASYKEPLNIIEETLTCFYNLTYPNKHLYLLDDTRYDQPWDTEENVLAYRKAIEALCEKLDINLFRRRWHGAKAGIINDFVSFIEGKPKEGTEFTAHSRNDKDEKSKYLIVFDSDMNPLPDFVEPLVQRMEKDPKLAFVQTPQFYTNILSNRLARASGLQQSVFHEYICEGKGLKNTMFCCGTNFIMRRNALVDVGGFDESSVTEDVSTSLLLHLKGWETSYVNVTTAFGLGPEELGSYFKQQFRWALGTFSLLKRVVKEMFRNPFRLPLMTWWEYILTTSHYLVGWVYFIMAICPVLFLLFNTPSYFTKPFIYVIFFTPYFLLTLSLFLWTLHDKRYRYKDLVLGTILNMICFPVYMRATLLGLLGVKGTFTTTQKGVGGLSLPMWRLWPQLGLAILCFSAGIWGLMRLYFEQEPIAALIMNIFWVFFHCAILSTIIYYNNPEERPIAPKEDEATLLAVAEEEY